MPKVASNSKHSFSGPYRIGLTGNIATGKSTVGQMLMALDAEFIDADKVTHKVIEPGGAAYDIVVAMFGTQILTPDGYIDRKKLGTIVFKDPASLTLLEDLIHPRVIAVIDDKVARSHAPVVVVEAIKLLESGLADTYDAIWVTTCSKTTQLKRLMNARHLNKSDAIQRIEAQPAPDAKLAQADVIIDTDGTVTATKAQVLRAWNKIMAGQEL